MRLATLLLTALLAVPDLAVAEPGESTPAAPSTSISAPQQAPVEERDPQFALGFTIGAPDGAVLFGVDLRPIDFFVFPVIHGEYGYYFAGQTSDRIKSWASVPENLWPLVGDASYNWWSALVGIGFGSRRGFEVRLEGGVTWLSLNVKGGTSSVNGVQITADPWKSQAFAPTARLNFLYFL
jgi:hypothetical protein